MSRRLARELALKALFQVDLVGGDGTQVLEYLFEEDKPLSEVEAFARELVAGTLAHRREIDAEIGRYARDWRLERLAAVDRNILRMAIFELLFRRDVPASVAINEAVELAKTYGEAESGRFVNGILGQLARDRAGGRTGTPEVAAGEGDEGHRGAVD